MKRPEQIPHLDAVYDLLADANTEGARNADRMGRWDTARVLDNTARDLRARAAAERNGGAS